MRRRNRRMAAHEESLPRAVESSVQTASMMVLGSIALAMIAGITLLLLWQSLLAALEMLPLR